jgi:hypothetical protein
MLALRFLLEITALVCFGYWGWHVFSELRYAAALLVPLLVATAWGVFATPGDKSRSGNTLIATAGPLRLLLELAVLFGSAAALYTTGAHTSALLLTALLAAYHAASIDRITWLLRH